MASNSHQEPWLLENGNVKSLSKEMRHGRTAHNMSSSSLRKKSDLTLVSRVPYACLRQLLANLQEVILGTKLFVLFPAIPLAILADSYAFGRVSYSYIYIYIPIITIWSRIDHRRLNNLNTFNIGLEFQDHGECPY